MREAALDTLRLLPRAAGVLPKAALRLPPALRRRLLALSLILGVLAAGYFGWLRESSFVRIEQVRVEGVSGPGSQRVRAALSDAAKGMTTLHIRHDDLARAVENEPLVHSLSVQTNFPHAVRIRVVQNTPVGVLVVRGRRVPVAADGSLLRELRAAELLPALPGGAFPRGSRLGEGHGLRLVQVAAAAPAALRRRIGSIRQSRAHGYVAQVRNGPEIWLGDLSALERKWKAAAAILAQPSSEGAEYLDVRVPARAVAGGLAEGAQSAEEQQAEAGATTAEPSPVTPTAPAQTAPEPQAGAATGGPVAPSPQAAPQAASPQQTAPSQQPQP